MVLRLGSHRTAYEGQACSRILYHTWYYSFHFCLFKFCYTNDTSWNTTTTLSIGGFPVRKRDFLPAWWTKISFPQRRIRRSLREGPVQPEHRRSSPALSGSLAGFSFPTLTHPGLSLVQPGAGIVCQREAETSYANRGYPRLWRREDST